MNSDENNKKFASSDQKIQELTEISQKYSKIISDVMLETQKNIIGQEDIIKKILISIISLFSSEFISCNFENLD